jgi:uncharacterized membrane protein YdbT with pleckstrin-like domain
MKDKEVKPLFVLKPNITNALFPLFIRNFIYSILFCGVLFAVYTLLTWLKILSINLEWTIAFFIILAFLISLIPLTSKIVILLCTKYIFYEESLIHQFKFINIKKDSVIYSRITNINLDITLWDRVCKAGDLTIHTADDTMPDIVLKYIKNPEEVEHKIYSLIKRSNKKVSETVQKNNSLF